MNCEVCKHRLRSLLSTIVPAACNRAAPKSATHTGSGAAKMASRRADAAEDHYRVLGVDRSASADEIKAAYRKQVLLHHPDRAALQNKAPSAVQDDDEQVIQRVNAAYDTLSDAQQRIKYDFDRFGTSLSPDIGKTVDQPHGSYKAMTADDVDTMFSGLNTYERFTTAQYHALRSKKAPATIGRRATGFEERKQFRASKLPTKNASMGWVAFPLFVVGLWAFNLKSLKQDAKKEQRMRR